jgi:hypothetical protein
MVRNESGVAGWLRLTRIRLNLACGCCAQAPPKHCTCVGDTLHLLQSAKLPSSLPGCASSMSVEQTLTTHITFPCAKLRSTCAVHAIYLRWQTPYA